MSDARGQLAPQGSEHGDLPRPKPVEPSADEPMWFRTIADMHAIPESRISAFALDLALWLKQHRMMERLHPGHKTSPRDEFGWMNDSRHDVTLQVTHQTMDRCENCTKMGAAKRGVYMCPVTGIGLKADGLKHFGCSQHSRRALEDTVMHLSVGAVDPHVDSNTGNPTTRDETYSERQIPDQDKP